MHEPLTGNPGRAAFSRVPWTAVLQTAITNSWTISAALWSCMASAAARLQLTRLYRAAKRAWWRLATGGLHFCKRARVGSQGPLESRLEATVPPCGQGLFSVLVCAAGTAGSVGENRAQNR